MNLVSSRYNDCVCVTKHIPNPHCLIEVTLVDGSKVYLCPTTYHNIVVFNRLVNPAGSERKHFSDYVQKLAPLLDTA